jgi:aminopeptidase N
VSHAFILLPHNTLKARKEALAEFETQWIDDALVMDTWFRIQAGSSLPSTLTEVQALEAHPSFSLKNPNKARALIGSFTRNTTAFHNVDGSGYEYVGNKIRELDAFNPQIAARMTTVFGRWAKYDVARQQLMQAELKRIRDRPGVSKDTFEIATRSLGDTNDE